MYTLEKIEYDSYKYLQTLALRNRVMRKPLGLNIADEDFSHEKNKTIIGAFKQQDLLGVGVLSNKNDVYTIDYLCVDSNIQSKGLGTALIKELEAIAIKNKAVKICLEARVSAMNFYKKHGYKEYGEVYLMSHAPVDHIRMEKNV